MLYGLFNNNNLIGIFDNINNLNYMIDGLTKNKYAKNLTFKSFYPNTICEFDDNHKNDDNNKNDNKEEVVQELDKEGLEEKSKIEYELNVLKKEKQRIEDSKKEYEVDLELYNRFKKIFEENPDFELPELFITKYKIFNELDINNNLSWDTFYQNYKKEDMTNSYSVLFDSDNAR